MENYYFHQNSDGWTEILNNITPDLHFIGSDGFATAHCCILRSVSPLIDDLYSSHGERPEILTVLIPDVTSEIIQGLIELIYLGHKITRSSEEMTSIMELLAMLRIDQIKISVDKTTFSTTPVTNITSSTSSTMQESDPLNNPLISSNETNNCEPEEITIKQEEIEYEENEILVEEASTMETEEDTTISSDIPVPAMEPDDEESEVIISDNSEISLEIWNPALGQNNRLHLPNKKEKKFTIVPTIPATPKRLILPRPQNAYSKELKNIRFPSWEAYRVANDERMKMMGMCSIVKTPKYNYCSFCDRTYSRLWSHAKIQHREYDQHFKYVCDFPNCSKRFLYQSQLDSHRLQHGINRELLKRRLDSPPKQNPL